VKQEKMPHVPHPQLLTLCLRVKRMTWIMKTTGRFCHPSNLSLFLSNSKNWLDLSIMPPPESPPIACFHLFFTDLILTLMVTESSR
jgi:hypothetical protein